MSLLQTPRKPRRVRGRSLFGRRSASSATHQKRVAFLRMAYPLPAVADSGHRDDHVNASPPPLSVLPMPVGQPAQGGTERGGLLDEPGRRRRKSKISEMMKIAAGDFQITSTASRRLRSTASPGSREGRGFLGGLRSSCDSSSWGFLSIIEAGSTKTTKQPTHQSKPFFPSATDHHP